MTPGKTSFSIIIIIGITDTTVIIIAIIIIITTVFIIIMQITNYNNYIDDNMDKNNDINENI